MSRAAGRKNLPRAPQADPGPDSPEGREIGESVRQDPAGSPIPGLTGNIVNYETVRQRVPVGESFDGFRGIMAHGVPNDSYTTEERATMERDGSLAQHQPFRPPKLAKASTAPAPVPVYITEPAGGSRPITTLATAKLTIPANTNGQSVRICARDETRVTMYALVETAAGSTSVSNPTPSQPSVPATGVAQQNVNSYPVQVVISANGATITNVSVNGVTVGTAAGTYVVPAYGSISIAYSVATPTWVWSYDGPNVLVTSTAPSGVRIDHELSVVETGEGALLRAGATGYQELKGCQDELFAMSNDGSACTLSLIYLYSVAAAG
jgi:hypothetical protein